MTDLNDMAQAGTLPTDPASQAQPVNGKARAEAEDAKRLVTVRQLLSDAHERLRTPKTRASVLTTGHWEIDQDTGGFRKGFVCVFGAKSSWGKSTYVIGVADENIKRGKRVLIVSAEDPQQLYGDRLLQRRARLSPYRMQANDLTNAEWSRVTEAANHGEDIPVYLDAIGKPVEWAAKKVSHIVRAEGIDLVCWDYLHAFDKEKRTENDRRAVLNYIARTMTDTMKTAGVAGIICGQVTPDTKAIIPDMYEIRDSKDVVNAADTVMIGFMASKPIERRGGAGVAEGERCIVLAKNKPGPGPKGRVYGFGKDPDGSDGKEARAYFACAEAQGYGFDEEYDNGGPI
jgi:replicative DNA helicase